MGKVLTIYWTCRGPSKGKVMLTPDYALRNVIRHQAQQAKVLSRSCILINTGAWLIAEAACSES